MNTLQGCHPNHASEAWALSSTDAAALGVFQKKVLRKIFGSIRVGDDYRIRTNRELYELFNDMDVAKRPYRSDE